MMGGKHLKVKLTEIEITDSTPRKLQLKWVKPTIPGTKNAEKIEECVDILFTPKIEDIRKMAITTRSQGVDADFFGIMHLFYTGENDTIFHGYAIAPNKEWGKKDIHEIKKYKREGSDGSTTASSQD